MSTRPRKSFSLLLLFGSYLWNAHDRTLIVFQAQISMHVDLKYLTERIPLIYDFGKVESRGGLTVDEVVRLCLVKKSHAPLVFLDRGTTRTLPSADFLAMFRVVITSTDRFKNEWSKGSFQNELKQADEVDETSIYNTYIKPEASCPLLKVHWLRLVVDEGHSMGRSQSSSTIQFASWIYAQRRWAMTGTPTKNSSELGQLKSLFKFLQHDFFGSRLDGSAWWRNGIFKSWKEGSLSAFFRLQSLLGVLMKRHTKLDIHELKLPIFEQSIVPMSAIEGERQFTAKMPIAAARLKYFFFALQLPHITHLFVACYRTLRLLPWRGKFPASRTRYCIALRLAMLATP